MAKYKNIKIRVSSCNPNIFTFGFLMLLIAVPIIIFCSTRYFPISIKNFKIIDREDIRESPAFITGHSISHYLSGILMFFVIGSILSCTKYKFFAKYWLLIVALLTFLIHTVYEVQSSIYTSKIDGEDDGYNSTLNSVGDTVVCAIGFILSYIYFRYYNPDFTTASAFISLVLYLLYATPWVQMGD